MGLVVWLDGSQYLDVVPDDVLVVGDIQVLVALHVELLDGASGIKLVHFNQVIGGDYLDHIQGHEVEEQVLFITWQLDLVVGVLDTVSVWYRLTFDDLVSTCLRVEGIQTYVEQLFFVLECDIMTLIDEENVLWLTSTYSISRMILLFSLNVWL